jgi:hypothetical protein
MPVPWQVHFSHNFARVDNFLMSLLKHLPVVWAIAPEWRQQLLLRIDGSRGLSSGILFILQVSRSELGAYQVHCRHPLAQIDRRHNG